MQGGNTDSAGDWVRCSTHWAGALEWERGPESAAPSVPALDPTYTDSTSGAWRYSGAVSHVFSLHGSKLSQGNTYDWSFRCLLHSIPAPCWAKDVIKPETANEGSQSWGRKRSGFKGLCPLKRNQKPCPMCNDSFIHPPKDVEELNEDKEKQRPRKLETLINQLQK